MVAGVLIVLIVLTITIISIRKYRFDFFDICMYYLSFYLLIRVTAHLYLISRLLLKNTLKYLSKNCHRASWDSAVR